MVVRADETPFQVIADMAQPDLLDADATLELQHVGIVGHDVIAIDRVLPIAAAEQIPTLRLHLKHQTRRWQPAAPA